MWIEWLERTLGGGNSAAFATRLPAVPMAAARRTEGEEGEALVANEAVIFPARPREELLGAVHPP
ncbi:MAG TPA: hypothetical protein VFA50_05090 [Stellaceae bacterium]|nr:hypothetical protein [Stellaceae bacterium]